MVRFDSFQAFLASWSHDWDLMGLKATGVLIACTLLALGSTRISPLRLEHQHTLALLRPYLCLLGYFTVYFLKAFKHYEAQLETARVLYLSFGFAFCLSAPRTPGVSSKPVALTAATSLALLLMQYISDFP